MRNCPKCKGCSALVYGSTWQGQSRQGSQGCEPTGSHQGWLSPFTSQSDVLPGYPRKPESQDHVRETQRAKQSLTCPVTAQHLQPHPNPSWRPPLGIHAHVLRRHGVEPSDVRGVIVHVPFKQLQGRQAAQPSLGGLFTLPLLSLPSPFPSLPLTPNQRAASELAHGPWTL